MGSRSWSLPVPRFGNIVGLFHVMSVAIRALGKDDADPQYMAKLAKIAAMDIISTKRFGNIVGLFHVMSVAIRALGKDDADPQYMAKLAKIAAMDIISTKEVSADWQRAASSVLVALGLHLPDLFKYKQTLLHLTLIDVIFCVHSTTQMYTYESFCRFLGM
ncbi:hypothetical protein Pfo_022417 [Paulownia fortunei]|nr:hypothetical protein Pfo_022417 [Paulownia fortunei]